MNLYWKYFLSSFAFFAIKAYPIAKNYFNGSELLFSCITQLTSNSNKLILFNFAICISIGIVFLITNFFFGELREIEKIVHFLNYFLNVLEFIR